MRVGLSALGDFCGADDNEDDVDDDNEVDDEDNDDDETIIVRDASNAASGEKRQSDTELAPSRNRTRALTQRWTPKIWALDMCHLREMQSENMGIGHVPFDKVGLRK